MISHFQWKELRNNLVRREWAFSFYYKGTFYKGTYYKDGTIEWTLKEPENEKEKVEQQIHDLMLYHIYEDHNPIS
ncbi:YheE family protein [Thalassorhabdus alkalitolerans]|uniref:YheE family protein n=1 Tax=Thalassorhabdus alkalitolerans TaxID=2282697 RepID=A0ABW0YS73_9BACI|nr:YheE family protein [Bacillus sp. FJAT-44742]